MKGSDWAPAAFFLGEFLLLGIVWLVGWLVERKNKKP